MSITDIIVASRAGTADLAGISLGSTVFNLSIMLVIGVVLANGAIIGQYFGADNTRDIRLQLQSSLWLCIPLGLFSASLIGVAMASLPALNTDADVVEITLSYLLPMAGTAMLLPFVVTFRTTFESIGLARPAMIFNVIGFLVNIPLDYALVVGAWGLPKMGGAGCGWATLMVSTAIVVGETIYARHAQALRRYRLLTNFAPPSTQMIRETLRIGLPIGGAILAEGGFFLLIPLFIAHLGAIVIGGHSVAITFDWAMFMIPMGISQAISVLVAHEIGLGHFAMARRICFTGLGLTASFALAQAAIVIAARDAIASLFSPDPAVQELAATLLIYAAAFRVFDAINVGGNGALRGYKDTRITVILAVFGYWLIGFPVSYSLALTNFWGPPMGVEGFWAGMVVTLIVTASLTSIRVNYTACSATHTTQC